MTKPKTASVSALMDCSHTSPGTTVPDHRIEDAEILVVIDPVQCTHTETMCPDCTSTWRNDFLFTQRLPWEHSGTTDT